ncbi:unknown [Clostridium sp. CAG:632]|nr:unknown [Clostridium sp. CAG:632]
MDEVIKELGLIPYEEDVTDEDDAEGVWEDVR